MERTCQDIVFGDAMPMVVQTRPMTHEDATMPAESGRRHNYGFRPSAGMRFFTLDVRTRVSLRIMDPQYVQVTPDGRKIFVNGVDYDRTEGLPAIFMNGIAYCIFMKEYPPKSEYDAELIVVMSNKDEITTVEQIITEDYLGNLLSDISVSGDHIANAIKEVLLEVSIPLVFHGRVEYDL